MKPPNPVVILSNTVVVLTFLLGTFYLLAGMKVTFCRQLWGLLLRYERFFNPFWSVPIFDVHRTNYYYGNQAHLSDEDELMAELYNSYH